MPLPKNSDVGRSWSAGRFARPCRPRCARLLSPLSLTLALVFLLTGFLPLTAAPGPFLAPGTKAPVTTLEDLDGQRHQLPGSGSWTLVFFWSLFCHLCLEELPVLVQETAHLASPPCQPYFVSLDTARMRKGLQNFLNKRHLTATVLLEEVASSTFLTADQWGVRTTPAVFLVDPAGVIRYSREGPFDLQELLGIMNPTAASASSPVVTSPAPDSSASPSSTKEIRHFPPSVASESGSPATASETGTPATPASSEVAPSTRGPS